MSHRHGRSPGIAAAERAPPVVKGRNSVAQLEANSWALPPMAAGADYRPARTFYVQKPTGGGEVYRRKAKSIEKSIVLEVTIASKVNSGIPESQISQLMLICICTCRVTRLLVTVIAGKRSGQSASE